MRYVGEPVAVIVATDRVSAVEARELVEIEYHPLPVFVDPDDAVSSGALLFSEGNVVDSWTTTVGDVEAALSGAARVLRESFSIGRQTGVPLEPRGLVAEWDGDARRLIVWGPTKVPYFNRRTLATMLGLDEAQIDFAESDVGGSFGVRGEFYPEDFLVPYLSRRLGRPVKWV
ncbi:MAG: xanthine dehydrogenase, partial [Candidatus Rokuibacteriota bacterium]